MKWSVLGFCVETHKGEFLFKRPQGFRITNISGVYHGQVFAFTDGAKQQDYRVVIHDASRTYGSRVPLCKETHLSCIVKCCEVGWCCSHIYINAKFRNQESDGFILPSDCCPVYSLGPQGILSGNTGLIGGKRNKNEKQRIWVPGPSDVSAEFGCLHTFFWADDRQLLSDSQSTN